MSTHTAEKKKYRRRLPSSEILLSPFSQFCPSLCSLLSAKLGIISKQLPRGAASYTIYIYMCTILCDIFAYGQKAPLNCHSLKWAVTFAVCLCQLRLQPKRKKQPTQGRDEGRGRWRRRRWWCCSWWLSSPGFKPFKMCCYDRAAVISSRWREAAAAAALQSSLYSEQSTQSLVFSVFACSASALRQALKLRAASTGLGGSLSLSFSMQIILRVGDIKREMTPLSHLSSSLHKLMLTRKAARTR